MCQHFYDQRELRGMRWQGTQGPALKRQARGNRISAPGHGALLIGKATRSQIGIDRLQSRSLWKRHEVIPPSIPDQIFDASFLPTGMHISKERLKAIDTLEMQKYVLLSSAMPWQHLENRWLEVVIDGDAWHPSPKLK